jgi:hypothetical protein
MTILIALGFMGSVTAAIVGAQAYFLKELSGSDSNEHNSARALAESIAGERSAST